MQLTENQILFPLSHPIKKQLDLYIAEQSDTEISYNDSVKIVDFFTNKREVDHFINSFKFSLKLMNNENKNHYFNIQCYYVYKLLTYKFDWIDSYLSILYDQGLTFSINLELEENSADSKESILNLFEEKQITHLENYQTENDIKINKIDFKICIDCLIFLFKSKHKFGFSDGAMYRMYYNDNVLGDISYSSLIEFIYAQIERNEAINFMHFFKDFEEKHFIENKKYYYGTTNLKIFNELVNFCFDFTSIPDKYYLSFLNGLNELKKEYSSVPFENNLNQKLIISCINFYKLNNSLEQYFDLYSFISENIEYKLDYKENSEVYINCIQFLNFGLNSSFKREFINKIIVGDFNVFHKILSCYNIGDIASKIDLDNKEIEDIIVKIIEKGKMGIEKKHSLIFNTRKPKEINKIFCYELPTKIQESAISFITANINEFFDKHEPDNEIKYYNNDRDNFDVWFDIFYFRIGKTRELFSFEINSTTESFIITNVLEITSQGRIAFYHRLYVDYLKFLLSIDPKIDPKNRTKFDYIKKIVEKEIDYNSDKSKFRSLYYPLNEFNQLRKDFGFSEFIISSTS